MSDNLEKELLQFILEEDLESKLILWRIKKQVEKQLEQQKQDEERERVVQENKEKELLRVQTLSMNQLIIASKKKRIVSHLEDQILSKLARNRSHNQSIINIIKEYIRNDRENRLKKIGGDKNNEREYYLRIYRYSFYDYIDGTYNQAYLDSLKEE
jgi:hypothetical protein